MTMTLTISPTELFVHWPFIDISDFTFYYDFYVELDAGIIVNDFYYTENLQGIEDFGHEYEN